MGASAPVWSVAITVIAALVVSDYVFSVRRTGVVGNLSGNCDCIRC
jgi:hypothetical protein